MIEDVVAVKLKILLRLYKYSILKLMPFHKTVHSEQLTVNRIENEDTIYTLPSTVYKRRRRFGFTLKRELINVQHNNGFTLIELLVVITIIGILATFTLANLSSSAAKGRDTKRKADLDAIKKALELYSNDTPGAANYPYTITGGTPLTPSYIKSLPIDPTTKQNYIYKAHKIDGITVCSGPDCATYTLTACLENNNDTGNNTLDKSASPDGASCTGNRIYQITN